MFLKKFDVTTLTVVDCGSPGLRIAKNGWFKKKISAKRGIGPIRVAILYQLYENVYQLIADTQAYFSALELGQKL